MTEHKAFVLMNRKTGDLMEGYRVSLFDKPDLEWSSDISFNVSTRFTIGVHEHDGWIVYSPRMSPFAVFFNRKADVFFEDLGEL